MTTAQGIHAHPTKKLGARAPSNGPALFLADHLVAGAIPAHPIADVAPTLSWPMDKNDAWGDCVVAGLDHSLQAICTALIGSYRNWTTDQILAFYRTQNPSFDPNSQTNGPESAADGGMDIQTFLAYLAKQGVILGFAKVDPTNEDEVKAAIYLGLAIVTGETLDVAQQSQKTWSYVKGSPTWGGHCTCWVGYPGSPDTDTCVTWGGLVPMAQSFVTNQVEEAWFVITQAHVEHPAFRQGFDLASFAAAFTDLTGRPFPAPVTPTPGPTPTPTPDPGAAPFPGASVAVASHIANAAGRARLSVTDYQNKHWTHYFGL